MRLPAFAPAAAILSRFRWPILAVGLLGCWLAVPAKAATVETHIYDLLRDGVDHYQNTMKVERYPDKTVVTYDNEFGDSEISTFAPDLRMMNVLYRYPDGTQTRSLYDHQKKAILVSGDNQGRFPLLRNTYDNNGALFFLLATAQPKPAEPFIFYLVQSNVKHIEDPLLRFLIAQLIGPVEMYIKYTHTEVIEALGSTCTAAHYVMGIHDARLAPFWPATYEFWFSTTDRRLIRYQGSNAFRKTDVLTLVDYYER